MNKGFDIMLPKEKEDTPTEDFYNQIRITLFGKEIKITIQIANRGQDDD